MCILACTEAAGFPAKGRSFEYSLDMQIDSPYSKKVQTKPKGTFTKDTSSFKKLRPPTKSMHSSETTGMVTHPSSGVIVPVQAITVGDTAQNMRILIRSYIYLSGPTGAAEAAMMKADTTRMTL